MAMDDHDYAHAPADHPDLSPRASSHENAALAPRRAELDKKTLRRQAWDAVRQMTHGRGNLNPVSGIAPPEPDGDRFPRPGRALAGHRLRRAPQVTARSPRPAASGTLHLPRQGGYFMPRPPYRAVAAASELARAQAGGTPGPGPCGPGR